MLDVTAPLPDRWTSRNAWHATSSNTRAIGIEIAAIGAVPIAPASHVESWYVPDGDGIETGLPGMGGKPGNTDAEFCRTSGASGTGHWTDPGRGTHPVRLHPATVPGLARLTGHPVPGIPKLPCDYPWELDGSCDDSRTSRSDPGPLSGILGTTTSRPARWDPGPSLMGTRRERSLSFLK